MARLIILGLAFVSAVPTAADLTLDRTTTTVTARLGDLEVRLEPRDGGIVLVGASAEGREVLRGPDPLWRAELRDRTGARALLHGGMGPVEVTAAGDDLRLSWPELALPGGGSAAVAVTMHFQPGEAAWRWRIGFARIPDGWTLYRYAFPIVSVAASEGDSCAFIEPVDWGTVTPDPLQGIDDTPRSYPSSSPCMQFYALQDGPALTYLGFHDPAARLKRFLWSADPQRRSLRLSVEQPTRLGFGERYAQEYPFVLQAMRGDWYDAAMVYRRWAQSAPWTWRGPLSAGRKTPRDFIETPLVLMRLGAESMDPRFVADWAVRMQEWFGAPITVHLYGWHRSYGSMSIDCYPDYFPAQPGFRKAVRTMEDAGIRVMPYLNARLWRTDQPSWAELGRLAAARDVYGRRYDEVWMQVPAAAMNPATLLWRWVLGEQALRCVEAGCRGVYLDQLATSRSLPSYAPDHPHRPGETAAWVEGGRALAEYILDEGRGIEPELIVGVEGNAEPYLSSVDTCLTGNLNHERSIPLFAAVYHDYVMSYGRYIMNADLSLPKAVLAKFAQQFVFGGQFGWSRAALERITVDGDPTAECLRAMAHLRHRFPDLLAAGRMLRPPDIGEMPIMKVRWMKWDREVEVAMPQVLSSAWQAADGTVGVLLVNIGDEPVRLTVGLPADRYPIRPAEQALLHRYVHGSGVLTEEVARYKEGVEVVVPAAMPLLLTMTGEAVELPKPPDRPAAEHLTGAATGFEGILPFPVPEVAGRRSSEQFPLRYEAQALPEGDLVWSLDGPGARGGSVSVADGIMHIDSLTDPAAQAVLLTARQGVGWDVDPMQGYTVEARLRVTACNNDERFACWLLAHTPETSTNAQIYPDRIVPLGCDPVAVDMAGAWHTVRLVGMPGAQTARLYLDGELIADGMRLVPGAPERAMLGVGAGATAGRIVADIDYVRFDPSHAWLPAQ